MKTHEPVIRTNIATLTIDPGLEWVRPDETGPGRYVPVRAATGVLEVRIDTTRTITMDVDEGEVQRIANPEQSMEQRNAVILDIAERDPERWATTTFQVGPQ